MKTNRNRDVFTRRKIAYKQNCRNIDKNSTSRKAKCCKVFFSPNNTLPLKNSIFVYKYLNANVFFHRTHSSRYRTKYLFVLQLGMKNIAETTDILSKKHDRKIKREMKQEDSTEDLI